MRRTFIQVDLFDENEVISTRTGELIDRRHLSGINEDRYYKVHEVAFFLGCEISLVYRMLDREFTGDKKIDQRFIEWIDRDRKYQKSSLARKWNCADRTVRKLANIGLLEKSPLQNTYRIPGWSILNFVAENVTHAATSKQLDGLKIGWLACAKWASQDLLRGIVRGFELLPLFCHSIRTTYRA